jgi:hypothetical protein
MAKKRLLPEVSFQEVDVVACSLCGGMTTHVRPCASCHAHFCEQCSGGDGDRCIECEDYDESNDCEPD